MSTTVPERRGTLADRLRASERRRTEGGVTSAVSEGFLAAASGARDLPGADHHVEGTGATAPTVRGTFGSRLTLALLSAALLPLLALGVMLVAIGAFRDDPALPRLILLAGVLTSLLAVVFASYLGSALTAPLRVIAAAVDRVSAGDLSTPIVLEGDDELARLAESHNRLAADLDRRNTELEAIRTAVDRTSADAGIEALLAQAAEEARRVFGLIDVEIRLVDPSSVPPEERIPGEALPVRAEVRAGDQPIGLLAGHLPATRSWEKADADLLGLFASEMGVAIRNAELFARVDLQNARLRELDAAKDDFLRGVSHNLQTPLTSIQAYADQLAIAAPDRRLTIIREQAERLSTDGPAAADGESSRVRRGPTANRDRRSGSADPTGVGSARCDGRGVRASRRLGRLARHRRPGSARPGVVGDPRQRDALRQWHVR